MEQSCKAAGTDEIIVDPRSWENDSAYQIADHSIPAVWKQTEGEGVVVGVVDTGCDMNHVDLVGNLLSGQAVQDPESPMSDPHGHGTFVTGIICAKRNNHGIHGVAPKSNVRPYRALNEHAVGSGDHIIEAMHRAIDDQVDIINLSVTMGGKHPAIHDVILRAYKQGIPIIAAAGNGGEFEHSDVAVPASYPETIAVGAIDADLKRTYFSQEGGNLDFVAPGFDIRSTFPGSEYRRAHGTSFATPWVAGVVALMIAKHRKYGGRTPINNVEDIRQHLSKTSIDLGDAGKDTKYGFGIIDVRKAIGLIDRKCPVPKRVVTATRPFYGSGLGRPGR
jgi:subtilisin family serine protease